MALPEITRIDHVSVLITDVEPCRHFYRDILGLKEIAKPRSFGFRVLWFDLGDGQTLHLLVKPEPDSISPRHFALGVRNVPAAKAYFQEQGIRTDETTVIAGCDRFFIHDPSGNRIEIIQWLNPYDPTVNGAAQLDVG